MPRKPPILDLDSLFEPEPQKGARPAPQLPPPPPLKPADLSPREARDLARAFVDRELDQHPGFFGRFVVQALRDALPIRICGSTRGEAHLRREDWSSFRNYFAIFDAYAGYFRDRMAAPYHLLPDFPSRSGSYLRSLPRTGKADVVKALANAMLAPEGKRLLDHPSPLTKAELIRELVRTDPALQGHERLLRRQKKGALQARLRRARAAGSRARKPVPPQEQRLTLLSMGGGRDSVALALIFANYDDPWLKRRFPKAAREARRYRSDHPDLDLLATFADTGSEFDFTYDTLARLGEYLDTRGDGHTGARHPFRLVSLNKPSDPKTGRKLEGREIMEAVRGQELLPASLTSSRALANQRWSHGIPGETAFEAAARGKHHLRPPLCLEHLLSGTMTARDNASCTANQKIEVMRRFAQDLTAERFGRVKPWRYKGERHTWEPWARAVAEGRVGRHRRIIGIHRDERGRADLRSGGKWPKRIVDLGTCYWTGEGEWIERQGYAGACYGDAVEEFHYPLIDWDIGEDGETEILAHYGFGDTRKSGCMHCHWMSRGWFFAVAASRRLAFEEAVALELGQALRRWRQHSAARQALKDVRDWSTEGLRQALRKASTEGNDLWQKAQETAGPRGLTIPQFLRRVAAGRLSMVRPITTIGGRGALLPCEVAYFAVHNPGANLADIFSKAYVRRGAAAYRGRPPRPDPTGFSKRFLDAVGP